VGHSSGVPKANLRPPRLRLSFWEPADGLHPDQINWKEKHSRVCVERGRKGREKSVYSIPTKKRPRTE
jgi:hypothetical protein